MDHETDNRLARLRPILSRLAEVPAATGWSGLVPGRSLMDDFQAGRAIEEAMPDISSFIKECPALAALLIGVGVFMERQRLNEIEAAQAERRDIREVQRHGH